MKKYVAILIVVLAGLVCPAFGQSGSGKSSESPTPGNRVLNLDGQADYVRVADSQSLHSFANAITIEAWFKASSFCTGNFSVNSIIRKNILAGAENFFLRFRIINGQPLVEMSPGSYIGVLRAPHEFTTGTWYHLAGIYDGSATTVLVNGVGINSERASGAMYIDQSDLFIGKGDPEFSSGEYFPGVLDEIRIWNITRSQEQIQAAMNTTLTGKEKGLVAYWNFDDGTAKDLSGHGNDGTLHQGAEIVASAHPTSTVSPPLPDANEYHTNLSITHLDISLKTDFQSNKVDTVVKASVESFSENTVETAEFQLCSTGNDRDFGADVKHIYLLEDNGKKDLQFTVRKIQDAYQKANEWEIYQVAFPKPVRPGQKCALQFEYTMTGKPDHSSAPILQSEQGLKEIYLRGGDYFWCPTPYFGEKPHVSIRLCQPSWTLRMECPTGYVVVTDGELLRREDKNGMVKDEWKSLIPGTPRLYVGQYKVVSRTAGGMTFEMYAPDQELLTKAAEKLEKYARMYRAYSELYGDPGYPVYRIVGSAVAGGGASFITGQMIQMSRLEDTHHIAHEMAHTWWGFLISASGGGYKFLSEAMAEFSARWILRVMAEEDEYRSLSDDCILGWKQRHFCLFFAVSDYTRTYVPLIHQEGYDRELVTGWNYSWGPLVANQIRLILGDEVFFRSLKAFVSEYSGKQVNIDDFVQTINAVSGRDMNSELKGLLWSAGYASYRLAGFVSEKADGGYCTKVRIQNEGEYGLTCPLLLKTIGGEKRTVFKVEGRQEKEFVFTTEYKVVDVLIDPDLTTLQYHPEQKFRLWMAIRIAGTNECYGKSYMYYALGEHRKALETISERLHDRMMLKKENSIDGLLKKDGYYAPYVFMRGVFYLGLDDVQHAEQDVKSAFPYMLAALQSGKSVSVPRAYYEVGAIERKDLGEYLALLRLIAAREFCFETGLDDAAKKAKVEEWKVWWEKEGKQKKLNLGPLKERFKTSRRAASLGQTALGISEGTPERARDGVVHIEEGVVLDIPDVRPLCDEMDVVKRRVNIGDCELYCEVEGDGTPLVLINGGPGGTHHAFHPAFSRAEGFASVIYYDQRGCGLSDYEAGEGYSVKQAVDDLEELRKALHIEKWIVLGHSYGGILAQAYCVTYPDSMAGLILLASGEAMSVRLNPTRQYMFITEKERAKMRAIREEISRLQRAGEDVGGQHVLFNNWLNGDWKRQSYYKPTREEIARIARYEWKHDSAFRQALLSDSGAVDLSGAFGIPPGGGPEDCPIPTLILEGKWDLTWDTDKAGILHQNHPNARLIIFEESAHSPFDDQPEAFFNTLQDFIVNLPQVPSEKLEQWKRYLAKWRQEKKDPLLASQISPEEA